MKQLPVFSAIRPVPQFDSHDDLRAAVATAAPTLGRLTTVGAPVPVRKASGQAEPSTAFSMSGFG